MVSCPAGTLSEAKQLSALQALLSLTSGPEAGFLGSSWVIILRCISALDALKVRADLAVFSLCLLWVYRRRCRIRKNEWEGLLSLMLLIAEGAEPC